MSAEPTQTSARDGGRPTPVVVLRPVGLATPLGYSGLAAGAGVTAAFHLGWIATAQQHGVAVALLAFVVPLQLVAALAALGSRDTQIATAFGVLSGTWAVVGLDLLRSPPGATDGATGVLLLVAGIALMSALVAAVQSRLVPAAVIALAAAHLFCDAAYDLSGADAVKDLTGIVGIALGAVALYTSLAMQIEEARGRTVLPLGRRGRGASALEGSFTDQIDGVAHSPGVRAQL